MSAGSDWGKLISLDEISELVERIHAHKSEHSSCQPPLITKGEVFAEIRESKAYLNDDVMVRAWVYCRLLEGFDKRYWDLVQDAKHIRIDIRNLH